MPVPHILIVDDEPAMRTVIAHIITHRHPASTLTLVEDGAAALQAFQESPIDLVITDGFMPVMDGVALTSALRALPSSVPIVMLSASAELERAAISAGVSRFLTKPVPLGLLRQVIADLLPA
jgi:CheY-like chemotaxis protein